MLHRLFTTRLILLTTRSGGHSGSIVYAPHLPQHPLARTGQQSLHCTLYPSSRLLSNQYCTAITMSEPQFFETITKVCPHLLSKLESRSVERPSCQLVADTISRTPTSRSPSKESIPPISVKPLTTWSRSLVGLTKYTAVPSSCPGLFGNPAFTVVQNDLNGNIAVSWLSTAGPM